jgi:hypothetical protein
VGSGITSDKIIAQMETKYFPHLKAQREEKERIRKAMNEKEVVRQSHNGLDIALKLFFMVFVGIPALVFFASMFGLR